VLVVGTVWCVVRVTLLHRSPLHGSEARFGLAKSTRASRRGRACDCRRRRCRRRRQSSGRVCLGVRVAFMHYSPIVYTFIFTFLNRSLDRCVVDDVGDAVG